MTALLAPGTKPANDAELVRSLHERIRKLETSPTSRVGEWVIGQDPASGALLANRPGQTINLSAPAAAVPSVDLSGLATTGDLMSSQNAIISAILGSGGSLGDLTDLFGLIPRLIDGFLPVSLIGGFAAAVGGIQQTLIDLIVNAIEGTPGFVGNAVELVFTGLNGIREGLAAAHEVADSLALYFQDMSALLVQIVQQGIARPVLGVIDQIMDAVSFWIFGWFHRTETAHTAQNAGIATLRGEVNARFAEVAAGTTGWVDNFDAPGYALTTNYTAVAGQASSTLGTRGSNPNVVLQPTVSDRSVHSYNTELTTAQVDLEMAMSNLAVKGRACLWIGSVNAAQALGLSTGTLVLRIDNQISDPAKQRLQIYSVAVAGTLASRGNLYSVDAGTWHDGDLLRLRKQEGNQIYRAYINNIEVCTFDDDPTNIINVGAGSRHVGWIQNLEESATNYGPDLDLIHAYDWTT